MSGKAKGNSNERALCRELSLWWSNGENDSIFWRTASSGAMATNRRKANKKTANQYGDICAIDPIGLPLTNLVTIEAKRGYSKDTIADLLDKHPRMKQQRFEGWIKQAEEDHKAAGSYSWLLIVKRDQRKSIVYMPKFLAESIWIDGLPSPYLNIEFSNIKIFATTLDQFFNLKPEWIHSLGRAND